MSRRDTLAYLGVILFLGIGLSTAMATESATKSIRRVKETSYGSTEGLQFDGNNKQTKRYWISPDGRHFAREMDHGERLLIDGKLMEHRLKEEGFVFSPDSQHVALVSLSDRGETLVLDGKELGTFAEIYLPLVFSPDSQHVAYFATPLGEPNAKRCVVIDSEVGDSSTDLGWDLAFEKDSQHVLYGAKIDSANVMLRRKLGKGHGAERMDHGPAELQNNFFFGPQGQVGYIAIYGEKQYGVIYDGHDDGQRLEQIKHSNIIVSRDGSQVAYVGDFSPIGNVAIHRGKRGTESLSNSNGRIVDATIQISPDGNRVAYVVQKGEKQQCVVDGKPGNDYAAVAYPEFSPDSKHWSYVAMKLQSPVVVVDGKESPQYAMAGQPEFTQDGKSFAYYAELKGKQFMVLNGQRGREFETVHKPFFNKKGSILVYTAESKDHDFMVINGRAQKNYLIAGASEFLDAGDRIVYLAVEKMNQEMVVVDQTEGKRYQRVITDQDTVIHVTSPNQFHYLAIKNDELFLVEETLE